MALRKPKKKGVKVEEGLGVKLKASKTADGKLRIEVSLTQDGKVVASDYDFVKL